MSIPQHQARELQEWIQERPREGKIDHIITPSEKEMEEMRMIEASMTAVGLVATGILIILILALVAYWVSPWAVVSILSLAALIWIWTHYK